jgi:outer membrane autotransporter protein
MDYMADAPARMQPASPAAPAAVSSVRPATWLRTFGDLEQRDEQVSFSFANMLFTRDLSYDQQTGGLLGGADLVFSGLTSANDGLILGAFTGYTASKVNLNAGGRQDFTGPTVGVYTTYLNGGFFADLMLKVDFQDLDIVALGLVQSADLRTTSVLGNVGYKIDMPGNWYIEPTLGFNHVRTDFRNETTLTLTSIPLEDSEATLGRIGARIGTEWATSNIRIEPSLTGFVYKVLEVSGFSPILGGFGGLTLPTDEGEVYGEVQASVNFFDLSSGWSGFARADLRFREDLLGGGGKLGIRYQW